MASATGHVRHPKGPPELDPDQRAAPYLHTFLDSSVGSKVLTALTGLGLAIFTLIHMIGNLKLFQGPHAINHYAYFLKHDLGVLIWIGRAVLLLIFVCHIALAVRLKQRSWAARPIGYQFPGSVQATIAGRTMIWTGAVVGVFILFHLAHFTFGLITTVEVAPGQYVNYLELRDAKDPMYPDVYSIVVAGFHKPLISFIYVVAQIALFMHLSHGVQSAFQTLGLKNRRFAGAIRIFGLAFAVTILVGNVGIVLAVQAGLVPALYPR